MNEPNGKQLSKIQNLTFLLLAQGYSDPAIAKLTNRTVEAVRYMVHEIYKTLDIQGIPKSEINKRVIAASYYRQHNPETSLAEQVKHVRIKNTFQTNSARTS